MKSNVHLVSNVLCVRTDESALPTAALVSKLGYFELMEYRRLNPVLFSYPNYQWTQRQLWELEGPRGRSNTSPGSLWRRRSDLEPVPPTKSENPFERPELRRTVDPGPTPNQRSTRDPDVASRPSREEISEQGLIIQAGIHEDVMVVAPPGTGKTHTLVERIAYLIEQRLVDNPQEQVLVLSFTRSAVAELRKRLNVKANSGISSDLPYVQVRTFDSFATGLLRLDLASDQIADGFSERIGQFNDLLAAGGLVKASEVLSKIRFLLVDEVQDLNGPRAKMVLALASLVGRNQGCSMFLGDPAQAIYDYEQDSVENAFTSLQFLREVYDGAYVGRPPVRMGLKTYRRFETDAMVDFVKDARGAMGEDGLSPDGSRIDELLGSLGKRVPLVSLPSVLDRALSTAVLTRNNLEAYCIWQLLDRLGIEAELWRGAQGNYWPGWVARLFMGFQSDAMSIEKAQQRWNSNIAMHVGISFDDAMLFLQQHGVMDEDAGSISVAGIAEHLRNSAPVASGQRADARVVVSTIHRSKGLEFDDVYLLAPNGMNGDEDVRIVYVAATRAKRALRVLQRDTAVIRWGAKRGRQIQTNCFHVQNFPQSPHIGLLVDGYDVVDTESIRSLDNPLAAQKRLWDECAGRRRSLQIDGSAALVAGSVIGRLSNAVAADIEKVRRLRSTTSGTLGELQIIDLASVALTSLRDQSVDELGPARIALVPVVTGLTYL